MHNAHITTFYEHKYQIELAKEQVMKKIKTDSNNNIEFLLFLTFTVTQYYNN